MLGFIAAGFYLKEMVFEVCFLSFYTCDFGAIFVS